MELELGTWSRHAAGVDSVQGGEGNEQPGNGAGGWADLPVCPVLSSFLPARLIAFFWLVQRERNMGNHAHRAETKRTSCLWL